MPLEQHPRSLGIWFAQLQAGQPIDVETRRLAARALHALPKRNPLQQMALAVISEAEDELTCEQCTTQLPDYVVALEDGAGKDAFIEVRHHLLHCPHCQIALDEAMTMMLAMRSDDLEALTASTQRAEEMFTSSPAVLQGMGAQVGKWARVAQDAIDIFLGQLMPAPQQWAHRAVEEEEIFRDVLGDREGIVGEILIFARPATVERCEVEVHLYRRETGADALEGLTLRLQYDDNEQQAVTDAGGAATFINVPRGKLETMRLRIPWLD